MDKNAYLEFIAGLEGDKATKQAQCDELERRHNEAKQKLSEVNIAISVIKSMYGNKFSEDRPTEPAITEQFKQLGFNPQTVSFVDACHKILEQSGQSMHASRIAEELGKIGKPTESRKVADSLRTDAKKRFVNLGNNIWDLRSRIERSDIQNTEENKNEVAVRAATSLFSSNEGCK